MLNGHAQVVLLCAREMGPETPRGSNNCFPNRWLIDRRSNLEHMDPLAKAFGPAWKVAILAKWLGETLPLPPSKGQQEPFYP